MKTVVRGNIAGYNKWRVPMQDGKLTGPGGNVWKEDWGKTQLLMAGLVSANSARALLQTIAQQSNNTST